MDLTASSSLRLVVVLMGILLIRCTYSGARVPPRLGFRFVVDLVGTDRGDEAQRSTASRCFPCSAKSLDALSCVELLQLRVSICRGVWRPRLRELMMMGAQGGK